MSQIYAIPQSQFRSAWRRLKRLFRRRKPSNLMLHAKRELEIAGLFDKDSDYGGMLGPAVLKMVKVFADEGHSGFSAGLAVSLFQKVARYEPLTPLTGADGEWNDVGHGVWQNRRCSHVFKTPEDGAYDIDGIVFEDDNGSRYTSRDSRVSVTFPYTPTRQVVKGD